MSCVPKKRLPSAAFATLALFQAGCYGAPSQDGPGSSGEVRSGSEGTACSEELPSCTESSNRGPMPSPSPMGTDANRAMVALGGQRLRAPSRSSVPLVLSGSQEPVAHALVETFYDLQGATATALRDEMNLKGPKDPNDHKPVDALTWSDFRWEWNTDCTLHMVNLRTVLTLPRYVGSDPALRNEFTTYASALRAHEERHLRLARHYGTLIADDLRTRTAGLRKTAAEARNCPSLNRVVQPSFEALLARFAKENAQLDFDTNHGISEGACWLCR